MADIGMCFQAPLVRAFLAGHKSQTRRTLSAARCLVDGHGMSAKRWAAMDFDWDSATIDPGPSPAGNPGPYLKVPSRANGTTYRIYPRPQVGDRMWVRETWQAFERGWDVYKGIPKARPSNCCVLYAADKVDGDLGWRPAIHMPRWAARIERDIVGLRFERLHDISEADAKAEGVRPLGGDFDAWVGREGPGDWVTPWPTAKEAFCNIWEGIHGFRSWDENPMLLVYEFAEARHG